MKIILVGATGAMGKVVSEVVLNSEHEIVCGISSKDQMCDYPIYNDFSKIDKKADVIIDFSVPNNLENILTYAKKVNIPVVLATTGYSKEDDELINTVSRDIPILKSGNMSLGVNLMKNLVSEMTKVLNDFDIEIVEAHHNKKVDAPSGTAKMLLESVESERNINKVVYGREGKDQKREKNDVGIHSIRGGSIVGEHTVIFAGEDELVEIKHTALSKKIFANGAIDAANYLLDKTNGLYTMDNVING